MAINPSPLLASDSPRDLTPGIRNLQLAFSGGVLSGEEIAEALTVAPSRQRLQRAQNIEALDLLPLEAESQRLALEQDILEAPARRQLSELQLRGALGQTEAALDVQSDVARMNQLKLQSQLDEFEGLLGSQPFATSENAVAFFQRTRPGEKVPQNRQLLAQKNREAFEAVQQFRSAVSRFTGTPSTESFVRVNPETFDKERVQVTFDGAGRVIREQVLGLVDVGEKAFTEQQANAVQYSTRMRQAEQNIQALEGVGFDPSDPLNYAAQWLSRHKLGGLVSSEAQQYEAAKRNWMAAVLRKESGAAISEAEYRGADHQYFPQPGDTLATRQQKARLRQTALTTMQEAGLGGVSVDQRSQIQSLFEAPVGPTVGDIKPMHEVVSDSQYAEMVAEKLPKPGTEKPPVDIQKPIQLGVSGAAPVVPPVQSAVPVINSPAEAAALPSNVKVFMTPDGRTLRNPNFKP